MRRLIFVLALLVPSISWSADCSVDQTIVKEVSPNGSTIASQQRQVTCKDKTKQVFSDCEMFQWRHQWGIGTSVSCNWSEREAMEAALTHAPDGFKIEWYDIERKQRGYTVVSWTRPPAQQGACRDIEMVKYTGGSFDKKMYIMCYNQDRGWVGFTGN